MTGNWKIPVEPTITQDYCDALLAEDHHKPHAFDTTFRYSSVAGCARAGSYDALRFEPTDPMDGPAIAVTGLGSEGHEKVQNAYLALHPDAEAEVASHIGDLISGSADIVHGPEVVEIKFLGGFAWDMAGGYIRFGKYKGHSNKGPKGPKRPHIIQAGMNAKALGCETIRLVYISREAISIPLAEQLGLNPVERFATEWVIPRSVWEPLVDEELERLHRIRNGVERGGRMAPRIWSDDDGKEKLLDPDTDVFPCLYCRHLGRCRQDGPGFIPVEITHKEAN